MKEELMAYGIKALEWVESGAGWIMGEIPVYVEEILRWAFWENMLGVIGGALIIAISVICIIITFKISKKQVEKLDDDFYYMINMVSLLFVCIFVITSVGLWDSIIAVVKISVAPRVYLIEYLSAMIVQ